jgi:hypothetical protein
MSRPLSKCIAQLSAHSKSGPDHVSPLTGLGEVDAHLLTDFRHHGNANLPGRVGSWPR